MVEGERDSITYDYKYDNLGNLDYIKDNGTGHFLDYTDDGIVIKDGENGPVIYETKDVTPEPETEEEATIEGVADNSTETDDGIPEIVSITQETAKGPSSEKSYNHKIYKSNYSEETGKSTENEAVSVVISQDENGDFTYGKTIGTQTLSDWFGRNEAVSVMTKDPIDTTSDFASISSQYSYVTNDNVTTNLISSVTNTITGEDTNTVNYTYTYDSNGRIVNTSSVSSVPNLSGASQYVYDEAGQLIKEITGSKTYEYAYDSKGNVSTRKVYSGETLVSTDNFAYASDTWEDRLTKYNGEEIEYDSIGNPTSYRGATLSWRGRELVSYIDVDKNKQISYSYDVDGMRYRKVVVEDNKESTYDYVYSDGTLILLTYTENGVHNTARFVYDSWGEPRGFVLNDTATYLYLKNAQGDITGIVDENGSVLLTYSYTAWGEVSFTATDMDSLILAGTLSNVNPFTYRGYCYDYDIGMYYLQSRYYDPEICRFINADSTDYLGATGTLLSYNLFAYCENDGVNFVDETGTWGVDTHYNWTYEIVKDVFCTHFAKKIATSCKDLDNLYPPFPKPGRVWAYKKWVDNQKFHFDRSKQLNLPEDSRIYYAKEYIDIAIKKWKESLKYERHPSKMDKYKRFALQNLGYALHCIQDYSAHGNYGVNRPYWIFSNHWLNADNPNYDWANDKRNKVVLSDKHERENETKLFTAVVILMFVVTLDGYFMCDECYWLWRIS